MVVYPIGHVAHAGIIFWNQLGTADVLQTDRPYCQKSLIGCHLGELLMLMPGGSASLEEQMPDWKRAD